VLALLGADAGRGAHAAAIDNQLIATALIRGG
jgi:hypothetical protein